MVCSWRCRICVDILRCFAGGWPRAFCSSVVDAAAASCCSDSMAHHTDGWLRPTNAAKPLFHASSGRRRSAWQHARSRWTPGTAAAADAAWCTKQRRRRRQPLQQVASSVCSLSVSSKSVTQPCSTRMPFTTSDSGRKATHALVIHEGGNVRACNKEARRNVRGKVSGGNVRLPD